LRLFLNRNINVMVWNYRGYGRTKGTPTPDIIKKDSEKLL